MRIDRNCVSASQGRNGSYVSVVLSVFRCSRVYCFVFLDTKKGILAIVDISAEVNTIVIPMVFSISTGFELNFITSFRIKAKINTLAPKMYVILSALLTLFSIICPF